MLAPITEVAAWLLVYKYILLFPVAVIEGPIISIIAGFFTSQGHLDFFTTLCILVVADMVGDTLYYCIGYFGRHKLLNRWGHYIGLNPGRLEYLEKHFHHHSGKTLLIGKITQVAGGGILVAAGAAKMPYGKFMFFNVVATIPKSLALLVVGYYFGEAYAEIDRYVRYGEEILFGMFIFGIVLWYGIQRWRRQITKAQTEELK